MYVVCTTRMTVRWNVRNDWCVIGWGRALITLGKLGWHIVWCVQHQMCQLPDTPHRSGTSVPLRQTFFNHNTRDQVRPHWSSMEQYSFSFDKKVCSFYSAKANMGTSPNSQILLLKLLWVAWWLWIVGLVRAGHGDSRPFLCSCISFVLLTHD